MADSRLSFDIFAKDRASATFLKVATASRLLNASLDDVRTNAGGLAKLTLAPALLPTLAVATSSLTSLTTALGAAAGAGGIFGIAVAGQVKDMIDQQKLIDQTSKKLDTLDKGSKDYADTVSKLHDQQAAFNEDFGPAAKGLDNMKTAWQGFLEKTRGVTTNVIGKTLNLVAIVLPKLVPTANAAGRAVGGLVDDLTGWAKSPAFDRLTNFFATSGAKNITRFGHVIGNTFLAIGGILSNFVGPGDKAAASLEHLTARFAAWSKSKGTSDGVQKFLDFANENGDKVSSILGSLAKIMPKLAGSFAGIGAITLAGASGFLSLVAGLPAPVFNAIATSLFAIAAGVKVVRLAVAAWAAIQFVLNAALSANPIGLVVLAIAALAAGLIYAYKHSETFRKIVDGAFSAVVTAGKFLWTALKGYFRFIINAWLTVAGAIVNGAARAFGWVPGLGPKLKAAANWFNDFRDSVNRKLNGVHTNLRVTADTSDARRKINAFATFYIQQMHRLPKNTHAGAAGGGGVLLTQTAGRRAAGGPVMAGLPYRVNERREEFFVPSVNGRIEPNAKRASGEDDYVTVVVVVRDESGKTLEQKLTREKRQRGGQRLAFETA